MFFGQKVKIKQNVQRVLKANILQNSLFKNEKLFIFGILQG